MKDFVGGSFCGKKIIVVPTIDAKECNCERFFRRYDFLFLARAICSLGERNFMSKDVGEFNGYHYSDETLCEAMRLAIKYAKGNEEHRLNEQRLLCLLQMASGVAEKKLLKHEDNPIEMMTVVSYNQHHDSIIHLIGRTWCLYSTVWPKDNSIKPLEDIMKIIGLNYKSILLFGLSACKGEYLFQYNDVQELSPYFGEKFNEDAHQKFLNYFSATPEEWLEQKIPPVYVNKPILDTGMEPKGVEKKVYFIPSKNNMIDRVTAGIYHDLSNYYRRDGRRNDFRVQFGYAFEAYVGKVLRYYLKEIFYSIIGEITYGPGGGSKTVDYFVKNGRKLVLIEVKQSGVYANAKYEAFSSNLKNDLKKTIGNAFNQIHRTKQLIHDGHDALSAFVDVDEILALVVLYDSLYNANNICKDLLKDEYGENPDIGIINITDLENLLDYQYDKQDFWELLKRKQENFIKYDFNEFLSSECSNRNNQNRFVKMYFEKIAKLNYSKDIP